MLVCCTSMGCPGRSSPSCFGSFSPPLRYQCFQAAMLASYFTSPYGSTSSNSGLVMADLKWASCLLQWRSVFPSVVFIRTAGPCMSQIVPPSLLSDMPSTLPCLPSVGGHWTQLQTPRILPQTMVSRPPPPFFLHYNESYLCGLPLRSLPPSKLSMAAGKVFECHSVHAVICLCVQWSPFCLGCSSYPLCLAIAYLPTSGSALRNISRGSLQLVRLSAKHANSILYFLALIIIIIEYLYNCWFDAGFSHSLVNSLRAGIMPAWLNSLPSASHNKYLPTECIMNGLDRSCGICYVYLYLCLKIGYLMF